MEIVEGSEKALAALAAEAGAARDYAGATAMLSLAQQISDAARRLLGSQRQPSPPPLSLLSARDPNPGTSVVESPVSSLSAPVARKSGAAGQYPRFKREDNTLVKIGWSKSDRSTYEHRSPRDVLDRLVAAAKAVQVPDQRFTTEDLMPLHDEQGNELPSYQAYLCLAWIVSVGILEKHGRQGYTVAAAGDLDAAVESAWQQLPRR